MVRKREKETITKDNVGYEYVAVAATLPTIARITGDDNRLDLAEDAAETVLSSTSVCPIIATVARFSLAILAVLRKDVVKAEELYAARVERDELGILFGIGNDRLHGLLAHVIGKFDDASVHFEEELELCRRVGYRTGLAWACSDYAEMLLDRDESGDRDRANELQDEALAITQELGMRPLTERILARREILMA